jgi:hypothetical protein
MEPDPSTEPQESCWKGVAIPPDVHPPQNRVIPDAPPPWGSFQILGTVITASRIYHYHTFCEPLTLRCVFCNNVPLLEFVLDTRHIFVCMKVLLFLSSSGILIP